MSNSKVEALLIELIESNAKMAQKLDMVMRHLGIVENNVEPQEDFDSLSRIVEALTSLDFRAQGTTFAAIKAACPSRPLTMEEKRTLSSMLSKAYSPPFYASKGAAKAAASQHAKAIYYLSNNIGDSGLDTLHEFLESI